MNRDFGSCGLTGYTIQFRGEIAFEIEVLGDIFHLELTIYKTTGQHELLREISYDPIAFEARKHVAVLATTPNR
jgi:hypothetical protein